MYMYGIIIADYIKAGVYLILKFKIALKATINLQHKPKVKAQRYQLKPKQKRLRNLF